jgi:hypothetical protein
LAEKYPDKTFVDGELKQMANLDLREAKQTGSWPDLVEQAQANSLAMGSRLENLYNTVLQTRDLAGVLARKRPGVHPCGTSD